MKLNQLLLIFILVFISSSCKDNDENKASKPNNKISVQPKVIPAGDSNIEAKYRTETIKKLKLFKPLGNISHQVEELQGKFLHHGGYIPVAEGGWIYCIGHSFHDDEKIGDMNIAIDQNGNLYYCKKHLCEGPAFWSSSRLGLNSIKEFYAEEWVPYKLESESAK